MDANFFGKAVDIPSGGILPTGRRVRCLGMRRLSSPQLTASAKTWASRRPSSGNPFCSTWHVTGPCAAIVKTDTPFHDHGNPGDEHRRRYRPRSPVRLHARLGARAARASRSREGECHIDVDLERFYDLYVDLMTRVALRHDADDLAVSPEHIVVDCPMKAVRRALLYALAFES